MKRLSSIILPCITIVTLATLLLLSSTGASAAAPQRQHNSCGVWSTVSSPNPGTSYNSLNGVAANNIWAVVGYNDASNNALTLIEHWNGTKWSVVNSPSPGSIASDPLAVARVPATHNVWSVGFTQGSIYQTLTEFRC